MIQTSDTPSELNRSSPAMVEAHAADAASLAADPAIPAHLLDGGEVVELKIKPSLWFMLFVSFRWFLAAGLVVVLAQSLSRATLCVGLTETLLIKTAVGVAIARLVAASLQWVSRLYVLTNRRVMCIRGVFNVDIFECQLARIQNTYLSLRIYERILGLGSIGFATAGTSGVESWWENITRPAEVHQRVRNAIARAQRGNGGTASL